MAGPGEVGVNRCEEGGRVQKLFFFSPWKSWRASGSRLKSSHNYSISMLSCAPLFFFIQATYHNRQGTWGHQKKSLSEPHCVLSPQPPSLHPAIDSQLLTGAREKPKASWELQVHLCHLLWWTTIWQRETNLHLRIKKVLIEAINEKSILFWKTKLLYRYRGGRVCGRFQSYISPPRWSQNVSVTPWWRAAPWGLNSSPSVSDRT